MIVEFNFRNFRSYKDEVNLLMTKVKSFKELEDTTVFHTKYFDLLKSAAIYGSNGGGKSNFMQAIVQMIKIVRNSYSDSLREENNRTYKRIPYYKLSDATEDEPTLFEITLIEQDVLYRYGFEIKGYEIEKEWLFRKNGTETSLFERNKQKFTINNNSFSEGNKFKDNINSNVLFLSHIAQNNGKISTIIFNCIAKIGVISGLDDTLPKIVTTRMLEYDNNFRRWLSIAVNFLNISNVALNQEKRTVVFHNKFDKNDIIKESVTFDLETEESQGTIKLIYLLGIIYDTLIKGHILFIDELDSRLHPNLTKKIIDFFHQFNRNNAQFIFTAHDSILLDKDLFRRDQIWFVDKNKFGSSELYSMSDFSTSVVKNTSDFRKKYLNMVFGAAKTIDVSDKLIELMYGEK